MKTMDGAAINEYLDRVMAGKVEVPTGIEGSAVEHFRRLRGAHDALSANLIRAEKQVVAFQAELASTNGEMKAYANILGEAEDARRTMLATPKEVPPPPISINKAENGEGTPKLVDPSHDNTELD